MRINRLDRYWPVAIAALLSASCTAQPSPAQSPATIPSAAGVAPASTQAEVSTDQLLDQMHELGRTLTSLRATLEMNTTDDVMGGNATRTGKFLLERRGEGDTRLRVNFEKLIQDDGNRKKTITERIEYLLEGDWVIDRVYGRSETDPGGRRETHRQIRKPGEKVDLLKLGEGPFPLPIGQSRESVRAQFEVTRLPDDSEKPGLIGLELRPREETRLAKKFHQIVIWVNPEDAMPRVIETVSADILVNPQTNKPELVAGTESKVTRLSDVEINKPVTAADFTLEPIDQAKWSIVTQEYHE